MKVLVSKETVVLYRMGNETQKVDIKSFDKGEVYAGRVEEHCTSITKVRVEILFNP